MDRNTLSPSCRPLDELEAEITELAGHLNAAQHRWLLLVAEFDRRKGWSDGACQSCAHWLNWKCGVSLGAAREKVRVAHRLAELPKISAAMSRGELSYSKVRALTRAASTETEDYFLSIALHGTASPRRAAGPLLPAGTGGGGAVTRGSAARRAKRELRV